MNTPFFQHLHNRRCIVNSIKVVNIPRITPTIIFIHCYIKWRYIMEVNYDMVVVIWYNIYILINEFVIIEQT